MKILGIWDGHDSGAALIEDSKILFAINEERLSRRKLEVEFPVRSIEACLGETNTPKGEISRIALSTSDPAKTLTRLIPGLKEEYYLIRRRKKELTQTSTFKKRVKYKLTEFGPSPFTRLLTERITKKSLKKMGLGAARLLIVDHHQAHAAGAAYCSGFESALVVTLDGLGDGLSGSVYNLDQGRLTRLKGIPARHSLGVCFEHVTNLLNMRELEDEGKVMALADYAYPIEDEANPLLDLIEVDGLSVRCRLPVLKMYDRLKRILWRYPSEQFAFMAQRTVEVKAAELIRNAVESTDSKRLCLAGGLFANVKLNRKLRLLPPLTGCFVFPHMGDGGLALGAALASQEAGKINVSPLDDVFFGPEYTDARIKAALSEENLEATRCDDPAAEAARLIADGEIVFWFQGRMEFGPRALGARSILARPDSLEIKDRLNLTLKKRVWYQPFCPSMLAEEAGELLSDYDGSPNGFMTTAYSVRPEKRASMIGVSNVDGSCRPQIIEPDGGLYSRLLQEIKKITGLGAVLNTSYNIHGEPMVCSPRDAVSTFIRTGNKYLIIGNYIVSQDRKEP